MIIINESKKVIGVFAKLISGWEIILVTIANNRIKIPILNHNYFVIRKRRFCIYNLKSNTNKNKF